MKDVIANGHQVEPSSMLQDDHDFRCAVSVQLGKHRPSAT